MTFSSFLCSAAIACGGADDDSPAPVVACSPGGAGGCGDGLVCEEVASAEPACFAPVVLQGRVTDLARRAPVEGATVVALDVNGSARSPVVLSDADGNYEIALPAPRSAEGVPLAASVTLRVAANGYQSFPTPPREALPIELGGDASVRSEGTWTVRNATTDVGLTPLASASAELGTVEGSIIGQEAAGSLVVAVKADRAVSTAVADVDGRFTLFNVPAGEVVIEAYRSGIVVAPQTATARAGEITSDVSLAATGDRLASVSGSVNVVNASGGEETSVILAVASTFQADTARGIAPAGLRAAGVTGAFSIVEVPPGRYAVLAAFENDQLVRDPDEGIAGTDIVFIDVGGDGTEVVMEESFKVTGALEVMAPGADALELLPPGDPTFVWADDSSEDGYELRVFDAFGKTVHEATDIARVTGSETVSYTWAGAVLEPGMIYQFRVLSYQEGRRTRGARTYISATEDLRGVFQVEE